MKHARILHDGAVADARSTDGENGPLRLADGKEVSGREATWLPPVIPNAIFALGLNYFDHAKELAFAAPATPLVFLKGPNTLTGHRAESPLPADAKQMHPECELAVIIGARAKNVRAEDALDIVAGYSVANDYAVREYLENYYRPNLRVKNRDRCTPLGPWFVPREDIKDPMDLELRTTINSVEVQRGSTRDMIFSVSDLIAYLSSFMTLNPNDIILTGTPGGVGFVKPGDVVVTEIAGVGRLENTLALDDASSSDQEGARK